jgi:protein TonB
MSYVDQKMGAGRITSIVMVAVLHALLGYALVTGMAYDAAKKVMEDLKTFDVKEPPPPEEEPPPEQPEQPVPMQPPPIVAPPPIVRLDTPPPPISTQSVIPPVAPPVTFTAPPAPPTPVPPPPRLKPAQAKTDLRRYFSDEDYPDTALRAEEQGTVRVSIVVGASGRATDCSVTSSSGSPALDRATCTIIRSRARFTPATDETGSPVSSTISSPPIVWRLPKE